MKKFMCGHSGQGLVEYALILALVAIIVIVALRTLGTEVRNKFNTVNGELINTQVG